MTCASCGGKEYAREIDYGTHRKWVKTCIECGKGIFPEKRDIDEVSYRKEEKQLYDIRKAEEIADA